MKSCEDHYLQQRLISVYMMVLESPKNMSTGILF